MDAETIIGLSFGAVILILSILAGTAFFRLDRERGREFLNGDGSDDGDGD